MRIAGRLALEGVVGSSGGCASRDRGTGYHGMDVVVSTLTPDSFVADLRASLPIGSQVRLRLPGLGAAHAQVLSSDEGRLHARFANPIGDGRLRRVPGFRRLAEAATA